MYQLHGTEFFALSWYFSKSRRPCSLILRTRSFHSVLSFSSLQTWFCDPASTAHGIFLDGLSYCSPFLSPGMLASVSSSKVSQEHARDLGHSPNPYSRGCGTAGCRHLKPIVNSRRPVAFSAKTLKNEGQSPDLTSYGIQISRFLTSGS